MTLAPYFRMSSAASRTWAVRSLRGSSTMILRSFIPPPLRRGEADDARLAVVRGVPHDREVQDAVPRHGLLAAEVGRDGGAQLGILGHHHRDRVVAEEDGLAEHGARALRVAQGLG